MPRAPPPRSCPLAHSAVGCAPVSPSRCCHKKGARPLPESVRLEELVSSARLEEGEYARQVRGYVRPPSFTVFTVTFILEAKIKPKVSGYLEPQTTNKMVDKS